MMRRSYYRLLVVMGIMLACEVAGILTGSFYVVMEMFVVGLLVWVLYEVQRAIKVIWEDRDQSSSKVLDDGIDRKGLPK